MEVLNHQHGLRLCEQVLGDLLEAVFNLTLVAHALAQCDQVELVGLHVLKRRRHFLIANALHDAINQTGLTNTGLTDNEQIGAVLTGKDFNDGEDFLVESDNGSLRHLCQHRDAVVVGAGSAGSSHTAASRSRSSLHHSTGLRSHHLLCL